MFYCRVAHRREEVAVGPYKIWVAGAPSLEDGDLDDFDLIVPLAKKELPMTFGKEYRVLCAYLYEQFEEEEIEGEQMGRLKSVWPDFVNRIIEELKAGKKILAFCFRGHGRTGLLLASLVALLETKEETPDPIAGVRERYCRRAVECWFEAELIFSLRGEKLPERYKDRGLLDD